MFSLQVPDFRVSSEFDWPWNDECRAIGKFMDIVVSLVIVIVAVAGRPLYV